MDTIVNKHANELFHEIAFQKILDVASEAKSISCNPDIPEYTSMDELKKALEN